MFSKILNNSKKTISRPINQKIFKVVKNLKINNPNFKKENNMTYKIILTNNNKHQKLINKFKLKINYKKLNIK